MESLVRVFYVKELNDPNFGYIFRTVPFPYLKKGKTTLVKQLLRKTS